MRQPKPVMIDADGTPWWNYLYSYDWEGKSYSFEICARSEAEAHARLKRLPLARFDGQGHGGPVPVNPVTRITIPLTVWWRNLWVAK